MTAFFFLVSCGFDSSYHLPVLYDIIISLFLHFVNDYLQYFREFLQNTIDMYGTYGNIQPQTTEQTFA